MMLSCSQRFDMKNVIVWLKLVSYLCAAIVIVLIGLATLVPHVIFKLSIKLALILRDDLEKLDLEK